MGFAIAKNKIKTFLIVFPTASGKSKIVEERLIKKLESVGFKEELEF